MQSDKSPFVAIGRRDHPRWLVPAGRRLCAESFLGWQPYRATSRLAWGAVKPFIRWGAPRLLPASHSADFDCLATMDWRRLGWRGTPDPEPLVYLGTPGEKRKAVVHLLDRNSHACELIVKVPLTEAAKHSIAHEAQTLVELQREGFEAAPRLVVLDSRDGVASQTVVHGSRAAMKLTHEAASLLQALELPNQSTTLREALSSFEPEAGRLELNPADMALVNRALNVIDDSSELPSVRVHGDFAPWNIRLQNGSAALVDWEDSRSHGLPLHDAYHFVHMTRCLFGKRPQSVAQEMRFRYCVEFGNLLRWKLELAYLVQSLVRELPRTDHTYATFLMAALGHAMAEQP
jgi:hypothetical protein